MTNPERLVRALDVGDRVGTYDGPGVIVKREEDTFYGSNSHGCIQRGGEFVSTAHDPYRYDVLLDRNVDNARTSPLGRWLGVESFDRSRLDPLEDTIFAKNARTVHYLKRIRRYYDGVDQSGADLAYTGEPEWHVVLVEPDAIDVEDKLTPVDLASTWFQEEGDGWEPSTSGAPSDHDWLTTSSRDEWGTYEESVWLYGFTDAEAEQVWKRAMR